MTLNTYNCLFAKKKPWTEFLVLRAMMVQKLGYGTPLKRVDIRTNCLLHSSTLIVKLQ